MRQTAVKNRDEIPGMYVKAFMDGKEEIESLQERITGRFCLRDDLQIKMETYLLKQTI